VVMIAAGTGIAPFRVSRENSVFKLCAVLSPSVHRLGRGQQSKALNATLHEENPVQATHVLTCQHVNILNEYISNVAGADCCMHAGIL
jgi:hypothetical protein